MRKELEQELANRWPRWFDMEGDPRETAMYRGFEHGDGWFDLVWRLCEQMEEVVDEGERPFKILQVKEKFGGLRVYTNSLNEAIFTLVDTAELESLHICEVCGQSGTRRDGRRIQTRCDEHTRDCSIPDAP
jgi:hypothetical protein